MLLCGVTLQAHKNNKNHLVSIQTQNKIVLEFDLAIVENSLKPVTIQAAKHKQHKKIDNQVYIQDIRNDVIWNIDGSFIIKIEDGNITALNEGSTTIEASYNGVKSSKVNIDVYKEINGYKLPPEPDDGLL